MANTLTGLIPTIYSALDIVSRELVGLIPSVTIDAASTRAAVGQSILVPLVPTQAAADVTPGQLPADDGDQTIGNTPVVITKSRYVPFRWTGEETQGINTGPGYMNLKSNQITQGIRTLANEIEADLAALYFRTSRAYGTAGTTPFGGATPTLTDAANVLKILKDNGAPENDLQLVINTAAGVNMRSVPNLTRANEAGGDSLLRQGILLDIFGMSIRESAQIKNAVKGTGAATYLTNSASLTIGTTTIPVDTGSGTILAGDFVTFAADTNNKYMVTSALSAGSFQIGAPGLRVAIPDNNAVTVGGAVSPAAMNMAFHRSSIVLVARPPALPEGGDAAVDRALVTDPRSGLTFEVAMYPQYRRMKYEISMAWGVAGIKPEHAAILLG
jgi:hypothetical protein